MKTIKVKYSFRNVGDYYPQTIIENVDVEHDSNTLELDQQIKWYFNKFILTSSMSEILPYEIIG